MTSILSTSKACLVISGKSCSMDPRYMRVPSLDVCYFMASCTANINKHDRIIAARKTLHKLLLEWEDIQPVRTSISLTSYIQIEVIKILWILYEPLE